MRRALMLGASGVIGLLAACGASDHEQDLFAAEVAELSQKAEQEAARDLPGAMAEAGDADDPGVATATSVTLPDNFPDDVSRYPEMILSAVTGMSDTMMLQGVSNDDMATVTEFYQRDMGEQGWVDESDLDGVDIGMRRLRFTQAHRVVDITLTPRGDQTSISLALAPRF